MSASETDTGRVLKTLAAHSAVPSVTFHAANAKVTVEKFAEIYRSLVRGGHITKWDEIWKALPKEILPPKPKTGELFAEESHHPNDRQRRTKKKEKPIKDFSEYLPEKP